MALNDKLLQSTTSADSSGSIDPRDHFGTVLYAGTGSAQSINGGKFDAGAGFNGSSSKIVLADNTFKYTALTISVWVYPSGSGERIIIETYNWTSSPGSQGWILKIDGTTNKAVMRAYHGDCGTAYPIDSSCTNVTEVSSNSAISTSAWTHIAITLDSSNMKMYINGTAQTGNTSVASNGFSYHASTKTNIGYLKYGSAADEQFFSGKIDQLRMYDEVLSASQVSDLASESYANSFKVNFPTGKSATALYRFNGNANDETGVYDGTATNVTWKYGVNFTPDFVWIKRRDGTENHYLQDSVRGSTKTIYSNLTNAEYNETTAVTSFDSGGFTLGAYNGVNNSTETYAAWCWNAGGSSVTNNDGSIESTVRANTDAGFSIVKYDYPHTDSSTVRTVGHGLEVAPSFMIIKNLEHASSWFVYSEALGNGYELNLNNANGKGTDANRWNSTSPSTDVFTLGTSFSSYAADYYGGETIAYCFHDVAGYQKAGSYSPADQDVPLLIETGFKVGWILIKRTDSNAGYNWVVMDNTRDTQNPIETYLTPDATFPEYSGSGVNIDFLDDGFRLNGTDSAWRGMNATGGTFIYLAIAVPPETTTPTLAKSFKVSTYTGDKPNDKIITDVGFSPSFVWIKNRDSADSHAMFDTIRGEYALESDSQNSQADFQGYFSFNHDGFTVGDSGQINESSDDFVAWSWKASDKIDILPKASSSAGQVSSMASINDEAGFSIVKWYGEGSGVNSGVMTTPHGLSAAPELIISRDIDNGDNWWVYHSSKSSANNWGYFNLTNEWQSGTYGYTNVNSTSFTSYITNNATNIISYCWRPISGFSSFGSYTASGSAGSPTINTGFQPDWVMVKNADRDQEWVIIDSVRGLGNTLQPNSDGAEYTGNSITVNSTSFTINVAGGGVNYQSGDTFIYAAFKMN